MLMCCDIWAGPVAACVEVDVCMAAANDIFILCLCHEMVKGHIEFTLSMCLCICVFVCVFQKCLRSIHVTLSCIEGLKMIWGK